MLGPVCVSVHLFYMNLNVVCICNSCSYVSKIEDNLFSKGGDICNSVVISCKSLRLCNVMCNVFCNLVNFQNQVKNLMFV